MIASFLVVFTLIQIEGESINDLAKVVMGEGKYEADWVSNSLAIFVIPDEASSGLFYLQNVYGKSNSMYINIENQREVTLGLNLPAAYRTHLWAGAAHLCWE